MADEAKKLVNLDVRVETSLAKLNDTPTSLVGYANICNVYVTQEEAILDFGIRDIAHTGEISVAEGNRVAKIYIGLDHAKRLGEALNNAMAGHEGKLETLVAQIKQRIQEEIEGASENDSSEA